MDTNRLHLHSAKETFKIVSGPSKDRLVDAFKYAYDDTTSIPVSFVISLRQISENHFVEMCVDDFRITSLQHEDGSGRSFNVSGYCSASFVEPQSELHKPIMYHCRFKAYYNAATRKGTIKFDIV